MFRATVETLMNQASSRSHMLVTGLVITAEDIKTSEVCYGKICLVDLAGSERGNRSEAKGEQLREASSINKSIHAAAGNQVTRAEEWE